MKNAVLFTICCLLLTLGPSCSSNNPVCDLGDVECRSGGRMFFCRVSTTSNGNFWKFSHTCSSKKCKSATTCAPKSTKKDAGSTQKQDGKSTAKYCGDSICETNESCETCPKDCGKCKPKCGDGTCNGQTENCAVCPQDCKCKSGTKCNKAKGIQACVYDPKCGNGKCDGQTENCFNCSKDCKCSSGQICSPKKQSCVKPYCGDGLCRSSDGERCYNCEVDCKCSSSLVCSKSKGGCCKQKTCSSYPKGICGIQSDGCDSTISCGCPKNYVCGHNKCKLNCSALCKNKCGKLSNGCNCGSCGYNSLCIGNVCKSCKPLCTGKCGNFLGCNCSIYKKCSKWYLCVQNQCVNCQELCLFKNKWCGNFSACGTNKNCVNSKCSSGYVCKSNKCTKKPPECSGGAGCAPEKLCCGGKCKLAKLQDDYGKNWMSAKSAYYKQTISGQLYPSSDVDLFQVKATLSANGKSVIPIKLKFNGPGLNCTLKRKKYGPNSPVTYASCNYAKAFTPQWGSGNGYYYYVEIRSQSSSKKGCWTLQVVKG